MLGRIKNMLLSSKKVTKEDKIELYIKNGRIPWSEGYLEYKEDYINNSVKSSDIISFFKTSNLPKDYGKGIDERSVEYPWIFSRLNDNNERLLDAGSTFNFQYIVNQEILKRKDLTIFTYYPESKCFYKKRISYVFGDLRELCFRDEYFDTVISQSTIEHIEMDNSIYGYETKEKNVTKKYGYLQAVSEQIRVLKRGGKLLITFPFGKFENHGFFQQFDNEMLERLTQLFNSKGTVEVCYFKYESEGWRYANQGELANVQSYNPHSGIGKGNDGAAHCRGIACVEFNKKLD